MGLLHLEKDECGCVYDGGHLLTACAKHTKEKTKMNLKDQINAIANRTKVRIYKPGGNPDDRVSLAGAPVQRDEEGRQFFEIPAHQAEYQAALHPHYEVGEAFVDEKPKRGRKGEAE